MEVDMILDDAADEEEGVVVVFMVVDGDVVAISVQGLDQLWPHQVGEELIVRTHINKAGWQGQRVPLRVQDIYSRVFRSSLRASKVGFKRLGAEHLALGRLTDGRHSSEASKALWLVGCADECAISTHAEAHDGAALSGDVEVAFNEVGQLLRHVRVHVEVLAPWGLGRIAVMTGSITNCPVSSSVGDGCIDTSWARVWEDHGDLSLLGRSCVATLDSCVLP